VIRTVMDANRHSTSNWSTSRSKRYSPPQTRLAPLPGRNVAASERLTGAMEADGAEQLGFRIPDVRRLVQRHAQFVIEPRTVQPGLSRAHADDVRRGG